MSSNGWNLNKDFPAYYGQFHALNPQENPIVTMLTAKGVTITPQKVYGLTYHTIPNASSANLKPDMASVTLGSTAFTNGSNTCQIWFEGAGESWARKGDQDLGRTLAWQNDSNPSVEPSTMDRGMAEALGRIKSQQEYIGREGQFNLPNGGTVSGTTGSWVQRGYRYAEGLTVTLADGAGTGAGTLGTLGTLSFDKLQDHLQAIYDTGNWANGQPLLAVCNSTVKRQLTDIFKTEYNMGKNGLSVTRAGVNLLAFDTDFGAVEILLTRNTPANDLYFLNMNKMELMVRPVPGKPDGGWLFETVLPDEQAGERRGIYTEMGMNYSSGSFHGHIVGIGSTVVGGQAVVQ